MAGGQWSVSCRAVTLDPRGQYGPGALGRVVTAGTAEGLPLPARAPRLRHMPLRETLNNIRRAPDPSNEEAAKFQILVPVLTALGWNTADGREVEPEYTIGGGRVDFALLNEGRAVAFIEAKAPGQRLDKHVEQVVNYAFHGGVKICALTSGLLWWLYLPMEGGIPFEDRCFADLRVREDDPDQLTADLMTFLDKDNLLSGRAEERAKRVLQARHDTNRLKTELPKMWNSMLVGVDHDLIELVRQRAYETLGLRPDRNQVAALLKGSPLPTRVPPPQPAPRGPEPKVPQPPSKSPPPEKPSAIRLWDEHYTVRSGIDILITVLEELHTRHGSTEFARILGHRISNDSNYFNRPKAVGSTGFYINRSIIVETIIRRSYSWLLLFGYSDSDLDILYD